MLPHPEHFFHVSLFYFRQKIIICWLYGVIAEVFGHSLDRLETWNIFAFTHNGQCLLATDSLRRLVRWVNTMLPHPHQVPYRAIVKWIYSNTICFQLNNSNIVNYNWCQIYKPHFVMVFCCYSFRYWHHQNYVDMHWAGSCGIYMRVIFTLHNQYINPWIDCQTKVWIRSQHVPCRLSSMRR